MIPVTKAELQLTYESAANYTHMVKPFESLITELFKQVRTSVKNKTQNDALIKCAHDLLDTMFRFTFDFRQFAPVFAKWIREEKTEIANKDFERINWVYSVLAKSRLKRPADLLNLRTGKVYKANWNHNDNLASIVEKARGTYISTASDLQRVDPDILLGFETIMQIFLELDIAIDKLYDEVVLIQEMWAGKRVSPHQQSINAESK